jgi:ribosomal protein S18 acetylase RimI-like enzyme
LGVLHQISIDRDCRHRGIGLALVEAVKARLRAEGVPHLRAIHGAFNEPSAGLLRRAGLRPLDIVAEGEA